MSKQRSQNKLPPTAREAAQRLQLLYSWRESLQARDHKRVRDRAAARRAQREIDVTRKRVQDEITRVGEELRRVFEADQQRPGNLVIEEKLGQLRHTIHQLTQVLKAGASGDLGGFVQMPLEHYPVELGLGRAPAGIRLERDDFITLTVAAAIIVIGCLAITWYKLWREDVNYTVERPAADRIALHFKNDSSFVAQFHGPWPESDTALERRSYGLRLYCRAEGAEDFQDCTSIREAWRYQGQMISPLKPVQVETGVAVTIHLHLDELEKLYGAPVEELRIACGNRRNRNDYSFSLDLRP